MISLSLVDMHLMIGCAAIKLKSLSYCDSVICGYHVYKDILYPMLAKIFER